MRIFPRNVDFFKLFEKQTDVLKRSVKVFSNLEKKADLHEQVIWMKDLEHKADEANHNVIMSLHQTFITPIDREDITMLTNYLDDTVDELDRFINRMYIYKINPTPKIVFEYGKLIEKSVLEVIGAVHSLKESKDRDKVLKHLSNINKLEHQTDDVHRKNVSDLFENEKDAINLIKLKGIYESLENVVDCCQRVARSIEMIIIKI